MRCEGHLKNWNQCKRNATRAILELPIAPGHTIQDHTFHYCETHANESLNGGLAKEIKE